MLGGFSHPNPARPSETLHVTYTKHTLRFYVPRKAQDIIVTCVWRTLVRCGQHPLDQDQGAEDTRVLGLPVIGITCHLFCHRRCFCPVPLTTSRRGRRLGFPGGGLNEHPTRRDVVTSFLRAHPSRGQGLELQNHHLWVLSDRMGPAFLF